MLAKGVKDAVKGNVKNDVKNDVITALRNRVARCQTVATSQIPAFRASKRRGGSGTMLFFRASFRSPRLRVRRFRSSIRGTVARRGSLRPRWRRTSNVTMEAAQWRPPVVS